MKAVLGIMEAGIWNIEVDLGIILASLEIMKAVVWILQDVLGIVNVLELQYDEFVKFSRWIGVCSTDLRLDTSTNGLKQVYTSPEAIQ